MAASQNSCLAVTGPFTKSIGIAAMRCHHGNEGSWRPTPRIFNSHKPSSGGGERTRTIMGNAKYIGRVGALAVALGIGTAVASTPGNALAEPDSTSSSFGSATSSAESSSSASSSGGSSVSSSSDSTSSPDPRTGIVQSSGGAQTSSTTATSDASTTRSSQPRRADRKIPGSAMGLPFTRNLARRRIVV